LSEPLILWTVYDHPSDYPHNFVARKFLVDDKGSTPTHAVIVADSIDCIRRQLVLWGLTCLTRSRDDDPNIVETWI